MIRLKEADAIKLLAGDPLDDSAHRSIREQLDNPGWDERGLFEQIVKLISSRAASRNFNPELLLALREALFTPSEWAAVWAAENTNLICRGCGKRLEYGEVQSCDDAAGVFCALCVEPTMIACSCGRGSARLADTDIRKLQKMRSSGSCAECGREGATRTAAPRGRPAADTPATLADPMYVPHAGGVADHMRELIEYDAIRAIPFQGNVVNPRRPLGIPAVQQEGVPIDEDRGNRR